MFQSRRFWFSYRLVGAAEGGVALVVAVFVELWLGCGVRNSMGSETSFRVFFWDFLEFLFNGERN